MRANKMGTRKIKIAVVIGLLCCMAMGMSVMAFDENYAYTVAPNETQTIGYLPGTSTFYINTRLNAGDVTIYLSGAANGSATFSHDTSRADWRVSVSNPSALLTIRITAGPRGASGTLHIWS